LTTRGAPYLSDSLAVKRRLGLVLAAPETHHAAVLKASLSCASVVVALAITGCNESESGSGSEMARKDAAVDAAAPSTDSGVSSPGATGAFEAGTPPQTDAGSVKEPGDAGIEPQDAAVAPGAPFVDAALLTDARAPVSFGDAATLSSNDASVDASPGARDAAAGPDGRDAASDDGGLVDAALPALPQAALDLATVEDDPEFFRWFGSASGDGTLGVPVSSGDLDGDGHEDLVMASFQASPLERTGAGQVAVVFGAGNFSGSLDLSVATDSVLTILGDGPQEATGSQLAIADLNGDETADLVICRQNYSPSAPDRIGAGAVSIVLGGPALRALADESGVLDLRYPPDDVPVVTMFGVDVLDRLGIWARAGDLTGDGIADLAVGADQRDSDGAPEAGEVYVLRGGTHLAQTTVIDLADFGSTPVEGHLTRVTPPKEAAGYHFGATIHIGDLDRNGRSELVVAAALVRSGASYPADGATSGSAVATGGAPPGGRAYIVWDDNFPADSWAAGRVVDLAAPPREVTELLSGATDEVSNLRLGEELLAGGDYDGDGRPDLFVGDMIARALGRSNAGAGFVIYDAARLRGLARLAVLEPPPEIEITTIAGAVPGAIATDTVRHGDFDADGFVDLMIASPNASPDLRVQAGTVHVLWGGTRRWPALIDLASPPSASLVPITEVWGVEGGGGVDAGDMLAYSAEVADVDRDGFDDLVANEMGGNGVEAGSTDAGNLLVLSGQLLARGRPDCLGALGGSARIDSCGICSLPGVETSCVSFALDVLPILLEACPSCHGASGGLSLFTYDQLMSGSSANGPVVVPGDPEQSILWQKLVGQPTFGDRMPPAPEAPLSDESIELFSSWIQGGARDN
jgi:hypothetical protein